MAPKPPRAMLVLGRLWIPLIVLAASAATAVACLSPKPTSLSTSLRGGGKEGAEIAVSEGTGVKDTATLSGENAGKATGTVDYAVYSDSKCEKLVTKAGSVTVKEGKVPASEEEKLEAGAVYYWRAEYLGDSIDEASKSPCGKEVLTVKAKTSLATSLSGGGKEGEEITAAEGSKVKDIATLSGTKASTATGTVDYAAYKDKECKALASKAGEGKVEGTKAGGSEEKELEAAAVYYWQAEYLGDSLHEKSTSPCKEILTVRAKTSLAATLTGQEEEEIFEGEEITVTEGFEVKDKATLSGTNASTATGTVKYSIYSDNECKKLVMSAGEGADEGMKVGSSEEEELEGETTYYWQAEYGGDSLHLPSATTCGKQFVLVQTFKYRSLSYPTSFSGRTGVLENETFGFNGAFVACHEEGGNTGGIYTGSLNSPSESLIIKPEYGNCGSLNGTGESGQIVSHGCAYQLGKPKKVGATFVANVSIACPELSMSYESINFGLVRCTMLVGSQANVAKFGLKNVSTPEPVRKYLRVEPNLVNFAYTVTLSEDLVECGSNVGNRNDGTYQGKFVLGGPGNGADLYIGP